MAFDLGAGRGGVRPSMNVTPLVDVVLVLLIIFMVVTPMLTKQLWRHVPPKRDDADQRPPPSPDALSPIVLTLGADGQPRVNGEAIARSELPQRLRRMLNARADKVVFFDASDAVAYGDAVTLMDEVRGGGVDAIAVLADGISSVSTL
jgi:biopolymer transport protein ExbD